MRIIACERRCCRRSAPRAGPTYGDCIGFCFSYTTGSTLVVNMCSELASGVGRYPPIGDYAVIGDCRSAALISRGGSIDWLCFPRFDSPSLFGAILDERKGGRFRIKPTGSFRVERHYVPGTNVLETIFHTSTGSVALRDLMPVASEEAKRTELMPDHHV